MKLFCAVANILKIIEIAPIQMNLCLLDICMCNKCISKHSVLKNKTVIFEIFTLK